MIKTLRIIGLMSGTSLDGIDLVFAEFIFKNDKINWNIIASEYFEYTTSWRNKLEHAHTLKTQDLLKLDAEYGLFLGENINAFIEKFKLEQIDGIASHGHTVFHQPNLGFTLQIGSGAQIQAKTNLKVIADFRTQDVALGGQGAPLVPVGDKFLFPNYEACINLGGFANISFDNSQKKRIAFDICPINFVINHLCQKLGLSYDKNGQIARNSNLNQDLLRRLNQIEFFKRKPPKSLGREWVEKEVFPMLDKSEISIENQISTFTHHAAIQISNVLNQNKLNHVLFSGGGAKNEFLIQLIQEKSKNKIQIADDIILDFKEALIFAFLGSLRMMNSINIFSSVTGSKRDSSSGIIYE